MPVTTVLFQTQSFRGDQFQDRSKLKGNMSTAKTVEPIKEWGVTWLVITGASRGLGAEICKGFSAHLAPNSVITAFARTESGLKNTEELVRAANSSVQFHGITKDLSAASTQSVRDSLTNCLNDLPMEFNRTVLVHNAGSLEPLDFLRNIDDIEVTKKYFDLNVSSVVPLTKIFLEISRSFSSIPTTHVINISSLSALSPTPSWGLYCAGKAARNMMMKVLAVEEGDRVHVLNYAPGPLDNDMMVIALTQTKDPSLKSLMGGMKAENKLVKMSESVKKLMKILEDGNFASGDHVDYFD